MRGRENREARGKNVQPLGVWVGTTERTGTQEGARRDSCGVERCLREEQRWDEGAEDHHALRRPDSDAVRRQRR